MFVCGATVIEEVVAPLLQPNVAPDGPDAVSVVDWFEQMELLPVMDTVGNGFTVICLEPVAVQADAFVTVTT